MKPKLLPVLLVLLILLNGVLIFMLIKKPHQRPKLNHKERNFLSEKLQFSDKQEIQFLEYDNAHRETMMVLDKEIRGRKDLLSKSFADEKINIDSIAKIIGDLELKKELEVFRFFKSVRNLCTENQQKEFDVIIEKAIKGGPPGLREGDRKGPPRNGGMPPPK
jgi:hypothetical protein